VTIELADLPGLTLGQTIGSLVLLDLDAAGYGWFIDPTPVENEEFHQVQGSTELAATVPSDAVGRMDLLTVVLHELGHVLGFDHVEADADAGSLMQATLAPGVRRLVAAEQDEAEPPGAPTAVSEQAEDPTATAQDAAVLVFDETAGTFQAQEATAPPAASTGPVLERTAFGTEEDTETPPAVATPATTGAPDGEDQAAGAAPASADAVVPHAASAPLITWERTFTAPPVGGQASGTPALAQVPTFVTLPAEPAAAAQAAGEQHHARPAEEAWPMPLSAPLVAGPAWGRERTREAGRG
jgi:hypothetical protein